MTLSHHTPALLFAAVLLLLIGGGVALSRDATAPPPVASGGPAVIPAAWTQPTGQPAQAWPQPQQPTQAQASAWPQQQPAQTWAQPQPQQPAQAWPQPQPQQPAQAWPQPAQQAPGVAPQPDSAAMIAFLQRAPAIPSGATAPHGPRGECQGCHRMLPPGAANAVPQGGTSSSASLFAAGAPPSAQGFAPAAVQQQPQPLPGGAALPFQEGHWQGIEAIALTAGLARVMKIPPGTQGVLIDEVTYPADEQGFAAGDVITAVGQRPTPDLRSFVDAADRVRDESRVQIDVLRSGVARQLQLSAPRLGNAVGESAPMIRSGSVPPHGYMGPCTSCHRIGNTSELPVDLGDLLAKSAPPIRQGQPRPHLDRGVCTVCHQIVP